VKHYQSTAHVRSLIPSLIHPRALASIGVYRRSLRSQRDLCGWSCTVILNPEKRKAGGSTLPLTIALTCAGVRLVIEKAQPVTLVVSFLGQPLQADGRPLTSGAPAPPGNSPAAIADDAGLAGVRPLVEEVLADTAK
jgi:hypothetical protein